jgi:TonB family protein
MIIWLIMMGLAAGIAAVMLSQYQAPPVVIHPAEQADVTQAFRRIQAETRPAIRRALLVDYVENYPQSPIINGAQQQLRVMNTYEASDWAKLSDIMFSEDLTALDKDFALNRYVDLWGEGLVGSRDEEVTAFKAALDALTSEAAIDRKFIPEKSPIPTTIEAGQMAGGQKTRPPLPRPAAPIIRRPVKVPQAQQEITPLRIRRNRAPDYPRRAYDRSIAAVVELSLNIDERGRVGLIETVNIDARRYKRDFERAARRAAKRTRFYPKMINGRAVPVRDIRKTYVFDPDL